MPSLFTFRGYLIFFWSNEGGEPTHVHVSKGKPSASSTKFWIREDGKVELAGNGSHIDPRTLRQLKRFLEENSEQIRDEWAKHFSQAHRSRGRHSRGA